MSNVIVTRNINGSLNVSDIVAGYFVTRTYYGYTRRQAVRLFKQHIKAMS
jgi:hypothetical protein